MLDDILKSAKEAVAERLASPLLGSFVVAWGVWNYKFLVILFSAATVSQTFALIDRIAFPDVVTVVTHGLLYPLVTALLYVFAYPYPAKFVYGFTHRRQQEINRLRQLIENETPLTVEESRKLRTEFIDADRRHQETVDHLNEEIARLKSALESAATALPTPPQREAAEVLYGTVTPTQMTLLRLLERADGKLSEPEFIRRSPEPKIQTEFDLGELVRNKLLSKDFDQILREYMFEFTQDGRRIFLNDGRVGT